MSVRRPFLLRLDAATLEALQAWAADDLRSVNGQMEFLLRRSLREAGRLRAEPRAKADGRHGDAREPEEAPPTIEDPDAAT
jgi:hypothetical protein